MLNTQINRKSLAVQQIVQSLSELMSRSQLMNMRRTMWQKVLELYVEYSQLVLCLCARSDAISAPSAEWDCQNVSLWKASRGELWLLASQVQEIIA